MLSSGSWIRSYNWNSTTWLGALSTPSGYIAMGASPPASGAIRIDAASYSGYALYWLRGTVQAFLYASTTNIEIGTNSAHDVNFTVANTKRWQIPNETAGTSSLVSWGSTARIVGGATNGLAIRNNANTRDNLRLYDDGSEMDLNGSVYATYWVSGASLGERPAGFYWTGNNSTNITIEASPSTGKQVVGTYYDGTTRRSAFEYASVASGFSTLALMKSGGAVVIGTDPGGTASLRTGGSIALGAASALAFFGRGTFLSPSDGIITISNAAATDFTRLQFGGTTASFPAIKRNGAQIDFRLADDTGYANVRGSTFVLNSGSLIDDSSDGVIRFRNNAGTDFTRLQFGGTTASFPSIKRNAATLQCRLADDSAYASLTVEQLRANSQITSASATAGVGYETGAGGAVTQITSRTTGVTLNKVCGAITLFTAAGSATYQTFTVTNSAVAATDVIIVNQKSGTDKYECHVTAVAAGSFAITFATTGGTTSEAPVLNFVVIKGVAA